MCRARIGTTGGKKRFYSADEVGTISRPQAGFIMSVCLIAARQGMWWSGYCWPWVLVWSSRPLTYTAINSLRNQHVTSDCVSLLKHLPYRCLIAVEREVVPLRGRARAPHDAVHQRVTGDLGLRPAEQIQLMGCQHRRPEQE